MAAIFYILQNLKKNYIQLIVKPSLVVKFDRSPTIIPVVVILIDSFFKF